MPSLLRDLNALGLLAVSFILLYAFNDQFIAGELPCPLCLLQRVGFAGVLAGLMLNVCFGCKPAHYSLAILSAVFGGAVALRQISLHVIPGTPAYGAPFLGFHFYTWAFICFAIIIIGLAIISSFNQQYQTASGFKSFRQQGRLPKVAIAVALLVVLTNALATFAECGPMVCPDNPVEYWLFNR
ncbi:Disulfide bond formation protein B [Sinobacterium norvegicum]|uniref:Disulfide bond formation protein B n=1 Tax=Sinobacterium norvegicum TaxID=1641715 RepID=A0ABM9AER2_9GAMM|nr:disulfide bond formation protein B [Sinobacterium norvegicum]CAH0991432.1 Disulfide bond formation protein B [Sinobacterium norvegicum]